MGEDGDCSSLTGSIISAAMMVHTALGPGLLESTYEACLAFELTQSGFNVKTQVPLPVIYGDVKLECGYRIDMVVENTVVVEIKAVETIALIHHAQLLSYLRLSKHHIGLLLNFHVEHMKDGIIRKCIFETNR